MLCPLSLVPWKNLVKIDKPVLEYLWAFSHGLKRILNHNALKNLAFKDKNNLKRIDSFLLSTESYLLYFRNKDCFKNLPLEKF